MAGAGISFGTFVLIVFVLWYVFALDHNPATDPDLKLSDPVAESKRQEIIRERNSRPEGYRSFTEAEHRIVYQREYENVERGTSGNIVKDVSDWVMVWVILKWVILPLAFIFLLKCLFGGSTS